MKKLQIKGLVIANAWTDEGAVSGVAIAANDESLFAIKTGTAMSAKLIKCLNQMVAIEGVWEDSGPKEQVLNVISLEILNDTRSEAV